MARKKGEDRSYFSVGRRRRNRNLMIIIPIIATVVITMSVMAFKFGATLHSNQMVLHIHPTLKVTSNGEPIMVPSQIGIAHDPLLYGNHSLDKYGMQGMAPLHTHDDSGTIHVESNTMRNFTLGDFLNIWKGSGIDSTTVKATVNGIPVSDFRNIMLKDRDSISLNIS